MKLAVGTRVLVGPEPTSEGSDFIVYEAANKEGVITRISGLSNYVVTMDDTKDFWYFAEKHVSEIKPEPEVGLTLKETLEGLLVSADQKLEESRTGLDEATAKFEFRKKQRDEIEEALEKLYSPKPRVWQKSADIPTDVPVADKDGDLYRWRHVHDPFSDARVWQCNDEAKLPGTWSKSIFFGSEIDTYAPFTEVID